MARKKITPETPKLIIPTWASRLYVGSALVLIPWTVYLGESLPTRHLSVNWDVSWSGLDIGLIIAMLATGFLAHWRSRWLVIPSSTVAGLLIADAWFDVMSSRHAAQFHEAVLLACLLELPMAITSYYVAYRVLQHIGG